MPVFVQQSPTDRVTGPSAIRLRVVTGPDAFLSLHSQWNALVERSQTSTIFQTHEWHRCYWRNFGERVRPIVLVAEAGGQLLGIAPLMLNHRRVVGRSQRVVEFLGAGVSDYCDLIVDSMSAGVAVALMTWVAEHRTEWDVVQFADVPSTSSTVETARHVFRRHGWWTDVRRLYEAPARLLNDPIADRQALASRHFQRPYDVLRRRGVLEVKHCVTAAEVEPALNDFFEQHIRRWSASGTPSLFVDERYRSFYRDLVSALAPKRWLWFSSLQLGGIPLAFHFGFQYGGRMIYYLPTFNVDYANYSPGRVLLRCLLQDAMDLGASELDFATGEELYKYRLANHLRVNQAVSAYRCQWSYQAVRMMLDMKARIKRSPTLWKFGRRMVRAISARVPHSVVPSAGRRGSGVNDGAGH
jgi:CelD/BcsL family acetyltransferase involved in cellulose biosynthesis